MTTIDSFFSSAEEKRIISAIKRVEKISSGEIRVHIDESNSTDLMDRAKKAFYALGMNATIERNGVLFYISTNQNGFVVLGDVGINNIIPDGFWDNLKDEVLKHFSKNKRIEGILKGIKIVGVFLKEHFPYKNAMNELPDEISRSTS